MKNANVTIIYELLGSPRRGEADDGHIKVVDVTHVPLYTLQRVFHVGPSNVMVEGRRYVSRDKAKTLEAFCSEPIDTENFDWQFRGRWSDEV